MRREHCVKSSLTPLQYIESSGSQWIDTGVKLNQNSRVVCKYIITAYQTAIRHGSGPFGARAGYLNNVFGVYSIVNNVRQFSVYYGQEEQNFFINSLQGKTINLDANKNVWNFTVGTTNYSKTFSSQTFQNQGNLYLFKWDYWEEHPNNNGIDPDLTDGGIRMLECDIYDNGTKIRQYRPNLNGNEAGLFDEINNVFYGNSGTEQFLYA